MYYYHAHAMALGGRLTHPELKSIESQASASLPITGGLAKAHMDNYRLVGLEGPISFNAAQCTVTGEPTAGNPYLHTTQVSIEIDELNVLNKVTADRIVLKMDCRHNCDPKSKEEEPSITTAGSDFVNLKINGHRVDIEMDHSTLADLGTYGKCADAFKDPNPKKKQALLDLMVGRGMPPQASGTDPQHRVDIYNGYNDLAADLGKTVVCSFVKKINRLDTGIKAWGPIIRIPNFGTVYLGELVISHGMRRLTMLRFELGSPQSGSVGVGTGTGNGTDYP